MPVAARRAGRGRARPLPDRSERDATLLAVLAYAALRPQEALILPWRNVRDRTLLSIVRRQSDDARLFH